MSETRSDLLRNASDILSILEAEHIDSTHNPETTAKLNKARQLTMGIIHLSGTMAPGLTHCAATTLLGVGLCQELSQRFVLEYCIKYKSKDMSLIILSNPSVGHTKEDHIFVQIGPVKVPEELFIGIGKAQGTSPGCTLNPEAKQDLMTFLANNRESIIADPLLHCSGNVDNGLTPLLDYAKKYNLTHIIGVRPFHNTPGFVENAPAVKENAVKVAKQVETQFGMTQAQSSSEKKATSKHQTTQPLSQHSEIDALVKKYNLPDNTQKSLEKGLRNAAMNNNVSDLKSFISVVKNIDAKDSNPQMQRTALHWASIKGHNDCCQALLSANAKSNIPDAQGKLASEYAAQFSTAAKIEKEVEPRAYIAQTQSSSEEKTGSNYQSTHPLFQHSEIDALIKKYKLSDNTQASLEKGLRNAAMNNNVADLKIFISVVKNINAKDTNPQMQRTALHWASIKGHKDCCQVLLDAGAEPNTPDAQGKIASEYAPQVLTAAKK